MFAFALGEGGEQFRAVGQDVVGELDERGDVEVVHAGGGGSAGGAELQRADAAGTDVAEPFHGVGAAGSAALAGQPGVNERVPVAVGQRVGEQAGQPVEAVGIQAGETVAAPGFERHLQRGDLDAA